MRYRSKIGLAVSSVLIATIAAWLFNHPAQASGLIQSAYNLIENGGSAVAREPTINFINGGCVDNPGSSRTDCTIGGALFSQTNSVTDAVQTTETSLVGTGSGSKILAANLYGVGTVVKFEANGFYSTGAVPGTLTINMKHSGGVTSTVTIGTTGAITPLASATNAVWRLWGNITCRTTGTGGTLIINTIFETAPSSLSVLTPAEASITNTTTVTVDTTAAQTVDLTAAWSAASQSITMTNFLLYSPNSAAGNGGGGGLSVSGFYLTDGTSYYTQYPSLVPVTRPSSLSLSWLTTQGTASVANVQGALTLTAPGTVGDALRLYGHAIGTNTTLTVLFSADDPIIQNFQSVGIALYESGTGKIVTYQTSLFAGNPPTAGCLYVSHWTNSTTFGSNVFTPTYPCAVTQWLQVTLSGGNILFRWSADGKTFPAFYSEAETSGFTTAPNNWGIVANANNSGGSQTVIMTDFAFNEQ